MTRTGFKNTFAPTVASDTLDAPMIIVGLRHGTITEDSLPPEVHDAVAAELDRRMRESISPSRALMLMLGTMGDVRGSARLQKYMFLVDMSMYSHKTRGLYNMYGWKSHRYGPHSTGLERYVSTAVNNGLVETFQIPAPDGKTGTGYRLTDTGMAEFQRLLASFSDDSDRIKSLLAKFAHDAQVDPLVRHVHSHYPEFTDKSMTHARATCADFAI